MESLKPLRRNILRGVGDAGEPPALPVDPCAAVANYRHCEQNVSLIPGTKGLERTRPVMIQEGQKMRSGKLSPRAAVECDPLFSPLIHLG